jgi:hypothetical protein
MRIAAGRWAIDRDRLFFPGLIKDFMACFGSLRVDNPSRSAYPEFDKWTTQLFTR